MTVDRPVFVVGCPRSGTTMVQLMLHAHRRMAIPPETRFLLPAYWQRLVVRPGLTGFAQVRRGYETSMAEKLSHDLEWIADRSLRLYLRTLGATALQVVRQLLHVKA